MATKFQKEMDLSIIKALKDNNGTADSYKALCKLMGRNFNSTIYQGVQRLISEGKIKTETTETGGHKIFLCEKNISLKNTKDPQTIENLIVTTLHNNNGLIDSYTKLSIKLGIKYSETVESVKSLVKKGIVTLLNGKNNSCNIVLTNKAEMLKTNPMIFNTNNLQEKILIALKSNNGVLSSLSEISKIVGHQKTQVRFAILDLEKKGKVTLEEYTNEDDRICVKVTLCQEKGQVKEEEIIPILKYDKFMEMDKNSFPQIQEFFASVSKIIEQNNQLKNDYNNLQEKYQELQDKYEVVLKQLENFSNLQNDIIVMANKIKEKNF